VVKTKNRKDEGVYGIYYEQYFIKGIKLSKASSWSS